MVMQDYPQNNCYQKSLFVIKMNFGRALAIMLSFLSSLLIVLTFGKLAYNLLGWDTHHAQHAPLMPIEMAMIAIYFLAAIIFFIFPLMLGVKKWFYELDGDVQKPMTVAFDYFRSFEQYKKAVSFQLRLASRKILVFAICFAPIIMIRMISNHLSHIKGIMGGVLFGVLILIEIVSLVVFVLVAIYVNFKYFLAPFLLFQSPLEKNSVLCERSVKLMQTGSKQEIGNLYISLCPFYILSFLIIPLLFLIPYIQLLTSAKAKEMICRANGRT